MYSPEIGDDTRRERLRYGAVHGSLEEVAVMVERRAVTIPMISPGNSARIDLANALTELFRCSIGSAVRRKLDPPPPAQADPAARIPAIHREIAALHLELAELLDSPGSQTTSVVAPPAAAFPPPHSVKAPVPTPLPPSPSSGSTPTRPVTAAPKPGHLQHHVAKHVPLSKATAQDVRAAFLAALQDGQLRYSGVHIGLFGSLVGQRLKGDSSLADLAPGSLRTWCLTEAAAAGIAASIDTLDPSIVRVKG